MNIKCNIEMSEEEKNQYVEYLEKKYNNKLKNLNITVDGDYVDLDYEFVAVPFERIRRITGYLTGDLDSWNDAKRHEENDRVKHSLGDSKIKMESLSPKFSTEDYGLEKAAAGKSKDKSMDK